MARSAHDPKTSFMGSIRGIAETLDSFGLDSKEILEASGIAPEQLNDTDARVPLAAMSKVIARGIDSNIGPLFGIKFAEHVHATTYHSFGVMLIAARTLRDFCVCSQRYYAYVSTGKQLTFEPEGEAPRLRYHQDPAAYQGDVGKFIQASGWAATWLKLLRMVIHPNFSPVKVTFTSAEPISDQKEISRYFACPVEYSSDADAIYFEGAASLDTLLPGGNAELARRSESMVFNQVRELGETDIANSVRIALFDLLPRGEFSLSCIAEEMDVPENEIRRGLKDLKKSLQQVVSETRRELAQDYILRMDLSVNQVAHMLGFSDCSNFARSFRRWTGKSPSDYRSQFHHLEP
jgi:AraC-like DNA-binding protein